MFLLASGLWKLYLLGAALVVGVVGAVIRAICAGWQEAFARKRSDSDQS